MTMQNLYLAFGSMVITNDGTRHMKFCMAVGHKHTSIFFMILFLYVNSQKVGDTVILWSYIGQISTVRICTSGNMHWNGSV